MLPVHKFGKWSVIVLATLLSQSCTDRVENRILGRQRLAEVMSPRGSTVDLTGDITNNGLSPAEIHSIRVSCGCMDAVLADKHGRRHALPFFLEPGNSAEFRVRVQAKSGTHVYEAALFSRLELLHKFRWKIKSCEMLTFRCLNNPTQMAVGEHTNVQFVLSSHGPPLELLRVPTIAGAPVRVRRLSPREIELASRVVAHSGGRLTCSYVVHTNLGAIDVSCSIHVSTTWSVSPGIAFANKNEAIEFRIVGIDAHSLGRIRATCEELAVGAIQIDQAAAGKFTVVVKNNLVRMWPIKVHLRVDGLPASNSVHIYDGRITGK